jgi:hypothetical protein
MARLIPGELPLVALCLLSPSLSAHAGPSPAEQERAAAEDRFEGGLSKADGSGRVQARELYETTVGPERAKLRGASSGPRPATASPPFAASLVRERYSGRIMSPPIRARRPGTPTTEVDEAEPDSGEIPAELNRDFKRDLKF